MPKRDKTDVSGGSSRPASAQHKSKRNNPDLRDSTDVEPSFAESEAHGQAKAEENGQAESGGGEDIDSDDEDYEETHGDDDDCGYNEEEYKSDPDAYDASLSFDPNRIRCHGQPEYLELGKCLSLFLLENGTMLYAYDSKVYTQKELRDSPWIKNLFDYVERKSRGVINIYMEIPDQADDKAKVGMTFVPRLRYELGYKDKEFIPVVLRSTQINEESDVKMSKTFDGLVDKYSKLGGVTVNIDTADVGVLYKLEKEHGVSGMFCLICVIMKSLPGDFEPTTIRKKLLAHFLESGLQAMLAGRLRSGTSPHELISMSNLPNLKNMHEHCVDNHDILFASTSIRDEHRDFIGESPIQPTSLSSWMTGTTNDHQCTFCEKDAFDCFPTFTVGVTCCSILGMNTSHNVFKDMVQFPPPGSDPYNVGAYSDDHLQGGFTNIFVPEFEVFLTQGGLVECLLIDWFPRLFSKVNNAAPYTQAKAGASDDVIDEAIEFDKEIYGVGPGTSSLAKYLHYRGFKPVEGTVMGANSDLVYFTRDDSIVNANGDLVSIGNLRIVAVHKSICWPAYSGFDLDRNEPAFSPATRDSMGQRAIAMYEMYLVCMTLRTVDAPLRIETHLDDMPLLGNILVQKALHVYALMSCHFDRKTATHLWKLVGVGVEIRQKHLRTYVHGKASTINDKRRRNPNIVMDILRTERFVKMVHYLTSPFGGNSSVEDAVKKAFDEVVTKDLKGEEQDYDVVRESVTERNRMLDGDKLPRVVKEQLDRVFLEYRETKKPTRTVNLPGGNDRDNMFGQDTGPGDADDSSSSEEGGFDIGRF